MKAAFTEDVLKRLASATDYREFLRTASEAHGKRSTKALLSRRAGFASRSFLTEIMNGKKGLSRDAMVRLKAALKLRGSVAMLFELLVAAKYPKVQHKKVSAQERQRRIEALRLELSRFSDHAAALADPHLSRPEFFQIYAALGTVTEGATISEIVSRSGIKGGVVRSTLGQLQKTGAVSKKTDRYYAVASKADALRSTDQHALSEMIFKVCGSIQKYRKEIPADKRNLSAYSAFSMRSEDIFKLRKKLEEAVFDVLDEFQDDSGDCIEHVFVCLFNRPLGIDLQPEKT